MGGRVTMVNSILTKFPVYHISFFKYPIKVIQEITSIQMNFLCGKRSAKKRGIAWISWKSICKSKAEGCLGIKDVSNFNRALLSKWIWRFLKEERALWVGILQERYGNLSRRLWFNEGPRKKGKDSYG